MPVHKEKCDSCRAILLEKSMKVLERVLEMGISCQFMTCSLASYLAREPLMLFSSYDMFKRHQARRKNLYYVCVDLEKAFDRVVVVVCPFQPSSMLIQVLRV